MAYMTTKTPLVPESWVYRGNYFKNPGEHGLEYSNNHSHLHKYNGEYYLFYHTLYLQKRYNVGGGFRSLFADRIQVNENTLEISMAVPTIAGLQQIRNFNPARNNFFATLAVSAALEFEPYDANGNMFITSQTDGSWSLVRSVEFPSGAKRITARVKGQGAIEIRLDSGDSAAIGRITSSNSGWNNVTVDLPSSVSGTKDLYFVFDEGVSAYTWTLN
jgi:arabinoxylan arabinofuranohydrolase